MGKSGRYLDFLVRTSSDHGDGGNINKSNADNYVIWSWDSAFSPFGKGKCAAHEDETPIRDPERRAVFCFAAAYKTPLPASVPPRD